MWEEQKKFRELLKTCPETKKDMEELRFWSELKLKWNSILSIQYLYEYKNHFWVYLWVWKTRTRIWKKYVDIIWTLEERHLRMFNYNNWDKVDFFIYIDNSWMLVASDYTSWETFDICELDNTKPFNEQSEEFYGKLNKFIEKEFNNKKYLK